MTFRDVITKVPGLTHYYPLDSASQAKDTVGTQHGTNHGATFSTQGATFDGASYVDLGDHNDFSAATTGAITVVTFLTITSWKGKGASEYVHWTGKGASNAHEWTFRHYVDGGSGEAATRQGRVSFYCFNLAGGLGAGSYAQDSEDTGEHMFAGAIDRVNTYMVKDGVQRDSDALSGYNITPKNGGAPVRLGTRDMSTGYLVGRLRRVAFFNRKLSTTELKLIYDARSQEEGSGSTPDPTPPDPTPTPGGSQVTVNGKSYPVAGYDRARGTDELIIYTPKYTQATTGTNQYGAEAKVRYGKVTASRSGVAGGYTIPRTGVVLSGHGTARDFLVANATVGAEVTLPST